MNRMIPCISLWQPYAQAIVTPDPKCVAQVDFLNREAKIYPIKRNETRHWEVMVRGRVLVHAALKDTRLLRKIAATWPFANYADRLKITPAHYGAIVGSVVVTGCITSDAWRFENFPTDNDEILKEALMGNYEPGRFIASLESPVFFKEPIPFKGRQAKFFNVPLSLIPSKYHIYFETEPVKSVLPTPDPVPAWKSIDAILRAIYEVRPPDCQLNMDSMGGRSLAIPAFVTYARPFAAAIPVHSVWAEALELYRVRIKLNEDKDYRLDRVFVDMMERVATAKNDLDLRFAIEFHAPLLVEIFDDKL